MKPFCNKQNRFDPPSGYWCLTGASFDRFSTVFNWFATEFWGVFDRYLTDLRLICG